MNICKKKGEEKDGVLRQASIGEDNGLQTSLLQ